MSNIDNLTSKILSDAKAAGEQIVSEAQEKADEKYEKSMKQVSQKKEKILESAKKEQVLLTDRIKSSANLKIRNEKLKAKQIVIDKVIEKLKEKLANMKKEDYMAYLNKNIDKNSISSKELIVKKEFLQDVKKEFKNAKIKENEFVSSGFIIEENGVQKNYTFEVKIDFMRDELEVEISKFLFS